MSVEIYEPAPIPADEPRQQRAVEESGALSVRHDPQLQEIVELARRRFDTPMAAVSIVYKDWQYLIATSGLPDGPYSRRTSFCGHAIRESGVMCVPDALLDPRFAGNPVVAVEGVLRFYAGAPLRDREGMFIGTVCVFDPKPHLAVQPDEEANLTRLAERVMDRLEQLRAAEEAGGMDAASALPRRINGR